MAAIDESCTYGPKTSSDIVNRSSLLPHSLSILTLNLSLPMSRFAREASQSPKRWTEFHVVRTRLL